MLEDRRLTPGAGASDVEKRFDVARRFRNCAESSLVNALRRGAPACGDGSSSAMNDDDGKGLLPTGKDVENLEEQVRSKEQTGSWEHKV